MPTREVPARGLLAFLRAAGQHVIFFISIIFWRFYNLAGLASHLDLGVSDVKSCASQSDVEASFFIGNGVAQGCDGGKDAAVHAGAIYEAGLGRVEHLCSSHSVELLDDTIFDELEIVELAGVGAVLVALDI